MEFWIGYKDIIADSEDRIEEGRDGVGEYIHRDLIVWMIIKILVDRKTHFIPNGVERPEIKAANQINKMYGVVFYHGAIPWLPVLTDTPMSYVNYFIIPKS